MTRHERWVLTGWDGDQKSVNPPFNERLPLPPHLHDPPGFCPHCSICLENLERANREHPERFVSRGRER